MLLPFDSPTSANVHGPNAGCRGSGMVIVPGLVPNDSAVRVARRAVGVSLAAAGAVAAACDRGEKTAGSARGSADVGWLGYNNSPDGQRYANLDQIAAGNVARLKPVCELRLGEEGPFQTGPVVIGDRMYLTTAHTTVAMNAATCAVQWRHVDSTGQQDPISVNRGAAYQDGRLFRGMPGARLAALDAATGKVLWEVKVGNLDVGEFVSSAPIAWRGTVFVGLAGGDWGIRGRVMGYDAATGKEKWRFYTIPMGSERGAETWHIPATAERGGGGMWTAYTLDTLAGELFVPVGNPAPDFAPNARPGDNLYTNSVIVLDAASGALKWWFQATSNDGFDYDMSAPPMLYSTTDGTPRVAVAGKDGHLFGIDRRTHRVVFETPVTTILNADKQPTPEGVRACPGPLGGVEWNGPALDPASHTIYVGTVDWCATFHSGEGEQLAYEPGDLYMGTAHAPDSSEHATGWVIALDGTTGTVKWRFHSPTPIVAGVTPTAGGVVFTGDLDGNFYALDKGTGKVLFTTNTGGAIAGGVVTYSVNGKQYVATTAGNVSRSTFKTAGSPRVIVMALDVPAWGPQMVALPAVTARGMLAGQAGNGQAQYEQFCAGCHGTRGEGGANGPSLVSATRTDLAAIVAFVKNPKPPMPDLHPSPLNDEAVDAVSKYVRDLQGGRR
jgi:alcohol dehydrogenase (cytochrome c)